MQFLDLRRVGLSGGRGAGHGVVPDLLREHDAQAPGVGREPELVSPYLQPVEALHPDFLHGRDCIIKGTWVVDFRAMRAVFVTTNENKLREAERILGVELGKVEPDVPEVQSLDFAEVAAHKASAARAGLGSPPYPVLVEDSGLVIGAWNGLPGALTKWFLSSVGNEGILGMLSGEDRAARAVCAVAVADAGGEVRVFEGVVWGGGSGGTPSSSRAGAVSRTPRWVRISIKPRTGRGPSGRYAGGWRSKVL